MRCHSPRQHNHDQQSSTYLFGLFVQTNGATSLPPTSSNLEKVSAPGIAVSKQVIDALQQLDDSERSLVIGKLAQSIALTQNIEKALIVRRFLLTGIKEGNVAGNEMAVKHIQAALEELNSEIELLRFEQDLRKENISDLMVRLLMNYKTTNEASLMTPALPPQDSRPLRNGRVEQ